MRVVRVLSITVPGPWADLTLCSLGITTTMTYTKHYQDLPLGSAFGVAKEKCPFQFPSQIHTVVMGSFWRNFILILVVVYLLGCLVRHHQRQREWNEANPYSFTGKEVTADPAKELSRILTKIPSFVAVEPSSSWDNFIQSTSTEIEHPKLRKMNAGIYKTVPTPPSTTASGVKPIIPNFLKDPPQGFWAFGVQWRRDTYPGKLYDHMGNAYNKITNALNWNVKNASTRSPTMS
jgi:hypothetical protein